MASTALLTPSHPAEIRGSDSALQKNGREDIYMTAKDTIQTRLRRLNWHAGGEAGLCLAPSALLRGAEALSHLLLAAVLAGASLWNGRAPFGVALVGAAGPGLMGGSALVGACFGYLALLPLSRGLRYAAAAILTFAAAFAFWDWKFIRRPWAMPLTAAAMNGCTGFVYLSREGWQPEAVALFFTELLLTALAARCYGAVLLPLRSGRRGDPQSLLYRAGISFLLCTLLMALGPVSLPSGLSLGRILGGTAALTAAWLGGCSTGAMTGVLLGLSMDLSGKGIPLYATVYGLSALGAGLLRGLRRPWAALTWLLLSASAALWGSAAYTPGALGYEAAGSCVLFLLLPGGPLRRLGAWLTPVQTGVSPDLQAQQLVRRRLEGAALAFRGLYQSINSAIRIPDNDSDPALIFRRAAARICRDCPRQADCWQQNYASTMDAMNHALPAVLARGQSAAEDFSPHFAQRCLHFSAYLGAVDRELSALLYRRQYNSRIRASRTAVARQYAQLSDLLGSAALDLSQELVPDQQALRRLRQRLRSLDLAPEAAVFRDSRGLLRIQLSGPGCRSLADPRQLRALSVLLNAPLKAEEGTGDSLTLVQQEPLMAVAGVAARKKDGETVSGDMGTYFKGPDGSLYVLLCDGMGSGPAANRESSLAVRLLEQFLKAGVETEHALVTVSSALALRGEEAGGFTTVDLLQVDLFTGRGAVYKLGAAPTYLRRGDQVRRLSGGALPAGLSGEGACRPDKLPLQLAPGDCVLMVSDGITGTGDDSWLQQRFAAFTGDSPKELARELVAHSPQRATDDRTALMVRIERRSV